MARPEMRKAYVSQELTLQLVAGTRSGRTVCYRKEVGEQEAWMSRGEYDQAPNLGRRLGTKTARIVRAKSATATPNNFPCRRGSASYVY
jgi:hypothetical protein